jgi:hypothetical protein
VFRFYLSKKHFSIVAKTILTLTEGCINDLICPCIFMNRCGNEFGKSVEYVYEINILKLLKSFQRLCRFLKEQVEMKDLEKTNFCRRLKIEQLNNEICVHKKTYIAKAIVFVNFVYG